VGCRMIDHRGSVSAQDVVQASAILDASDLRMEGNLRERLVHFAINFEQRGLGDFESDDLGGVKARDLRAKFGADGSCHAGDKKDFPFERASDLAFFEAYRGPAKEILDCHLADLASEAALL